VLEKHLPRDPEMVGPDHAASLSPEEFSYMVAAIRDVEASLGGPEKQVTNAEAANRGVARRSLVAARNIAPGTILTPDDLAAKRPGNGLSPMQCWDLLGTVTHRSYRAGEQIKSS
jgi:N-acetylneuraminate synthase